MNETHLPENTIGALTYLSNGKWVDEQTLTRRFGEALISDLYEAGAIARRKNEDPMWKGFQYSITSDGKLLLKLGNDDD